MGQGPNSTLRADFLCQSVAKLAFSAEPSSGETAAIRCLVEVTPGTAPAAQPASRTSGGPGGAQGSLCKTDCRLHLRGHFLGSQNCSATESIHFGSIRSCNVQAWQRLRPLGQRGEQRNVPSRGVGDQGTEESFPQQPAVPFSLSHTHPVMLISSDRP